MIALVETDHYRKEIKELYKTAFPKNEKVPLPLLYIAAWKKENSFYAAVDDGKFVGLAYTICRDRLVYLFYMAVSGEVRERGYGSRILEKVKELRDDCTVILSIEDTEDTDAPNIDQRLKRLRFYEKNGFRRLCIRINEAGVVYELLATRPVTRQEYLDMLRRFFGPVLFRLIYLREDRV